jgi:hypothetical protein
MTSFPESNQNGYPPEPPEPEPDRCAECARAEIYVHTARLERAHDREVIEALKAKLAEAERALRQQQKGKK